MMKKTGLLFVFLCGLSVTGCGGTPTGTPDGTIHLLFEQVRTGEITAMNKLLSSGVVGEYGSKQLGTIFGVESGITHIETEVLEEENLRAKVFITLFRKTSDGEILRAAGRRPVDLVFRDGGWKIDVEPSDWPKGLSISNYK